MPIRSKLSEVILLVSVLAQGTAFAEGFCKEGIEKKINTVQTALDSVRKIVPAVPPQSANYFEQEYSSAVQSLSTARLRAVTDQPYFNEWKLLRSLAQIESTVRVLKEAPSTWAVHPFPSVPQVRIFWASQILLQLSLLEKETTKYADLQQRSSQRMVPEAKLHLLDTTPMAFPVAQIIECELDNLTQKSGQVLKTYPR